jgi:hypothetical protein
LPYLEQRWESAAAPDLSKTSGGAGGSAARSGEAGEAVKTKDSSGLTRMEMSGGPAARPSSRRQSSDESRGGDGMYPRRLDHVSI